MMGAHADVDVDDMVVRSNGRVDGHRACQSSTVIRRHPQGGWWWTTHTVRELQRKTAKCRLSVSGGRWRGRMERTTPAQFGLVITAIDMRHGCIDWSLGQRDKRLRDGPDGGSKGSQEDRRRAWRRARTYTSPKELTGRHPVAGVAELIGGAVMKKHRQRMGCVERCVACVRPGYGVLDSGSGKKRGQKKRKRPDMILRIGDAGMGGVEATRGHGRDDMLDPHITVR